MRGHRCPALCICRMVGEGVSERPLGPSQQCCTFEQEKSVLLVARCIHRAGESHNRSLDGFATCGRHVECLAAALAPCLPQASKRWENKPEIKNYVQKVE